MKNLLLVVALLLACSMSAKSPELEITPQPLPDGVSAVFPTQGFVEVSGSAYPKGVSNVGVNFSSYIVPNPDNTTPALLYFNDMETPADTTLASSVDVMTNIGGGVVFKGATWNKTGIYKVEIPEGFWKFEEGALTPALTLYYQIYIGYNVLPTPGVVPEIENIVLTFPDADKIVATSNPTLELEFYKDNSDAQYTTAYSIMDYNGDGKENEVVFTIGTSDGISQIFIEPGIFGLRVDAGYFEYITYGPNYAADPTDFVSRKNEALLFKYQIPSIPMPEINPETDYPVESFDYFILYMPDSFEKFFANDRTSSNLYAVNENGIVDDSRSLCRVRFVPENNYENPETEECFPDMIILNLFDVESGEPLESFTPAPGTYCLRLADGLFSGVYTSQIEGVDPEFVNSSPFDYYYIVEDSSAVKNVEEVAAAEEVVTIYTLSGIRVAHNENPAVISSLKPGIYIVNGKKVLKK